MQIFSRRIWWKSRVQTMRRHLRVRLLQQRPLLQRLHQLRPLQHQLPHLRWLYHQAVLLFPLDWLPLRAPLIRFHLDWLLLLGPQSLPASSFRPARHPPSLVQRPTRRELHPTKLALHLTPSKLAQRPTQSPRVQLPRARLLWCLRAPQVAHCPASPYH